MIWTVGTLAVLSVRRRLPPVRAVLAPAHDTGSTRSPGRSPRRRGTQEWLASGCSRSRSAWPGSRVAWAIYAREAPHGAEAGARSSRRSSTGTSSTTSSATAAPTWSRARSDAFVERPLIAGSIERGHARLRARLARALGRARTASSAPTRSRSRAGIAVLAVVFLGERDDDWLTTILIFLPVAGALVVWLAAAAALLGRLARVARLARRGRRSGSRARRSSTSARRRCSSTSSARGSATSASATTSASTRFSLWLVGLTAIVMAALRDLRLVGRPRAAARVLRADALPDRRGRRRLHRAGPAALLRVLRGDADPALRADRRLGRRRTGCARRSRSSSTRSSARC